MVNKKRLVKLFLELLKIDSESGNEKKVRKYLKKRLCALELDVAVDKKGNLYAIHHGTVAGPSLLFSSHMDTVTPGKGIIPVVKDNKILSKGNTILGADDKSGIAEIVEMITVIKEKKLDSASIVLIFTVEEEVGLKGVKKIQPIQVDYGFVLDLGGEIGTIAVKAPNHDAFVATVTGKAAHAGIEPEKGINAIVCVSKAIAACKLGRIDVDTVANIGIINGGRATNIVAEEVVVKGEVRSFSKKKLRKQMLTLKEAFIAQCKKAGASVEFVETKEYSSFDLSKQKTLIKICKKAAKKAGLKYNPISTGGGSDANFFNEMGIPTAVLSTGMSKVHTSSEEIKVSDMVKATEYILAIVNRASKQKL